MTPPDHDARRSLRTNHFREWPEPCLLCRCAPCDCPKGLLDTKFLDPYEGESLGRRDRKRLKRTG